MKKSNDDELLSELPIVDYSKVPKLVGEVVAKGQYILTKKAKLTWDGKQFILRIPSEITNEMHITKENQISFRLIKPRPDSDDDIKIEMELV
jgi:hypothetical protein